MNYPLDGQTTPDMMFANGQQSITVNFNSKTGDTWATLLVQDFAASGEIKVTVQSGKTTFALKPLRLPVDANADRLPDAGWMAGQTLVASSAVTPEEDLDTEPFATGTPALGLLGDGLTAFEEYRGFIVAGNFIRLNPGRKDLFVVADVEMLVQPVNALTLMAGLPHRVHYLDFHEAAMTANADPALDEVRPVVNFNRTGLSGASAQRAVRLRLRLDAPGFRDAQTGEVLGRADFKAAGYTWVDAEDLKTIHAPSQHPLSTPNGTQVVEYYPRAFENFAISYGPNGVRDTVTDQAGRAIVICTDPAQQTGCVVDDPQNKLMFRPNLESELFARAGGDDYYTKVSMTACPVFTGRAILTKQQFDYARTVVAAHEVAHALAVGHNVTCGDLMFASTFIQGTQQSRISVIDVLPLPTGYSFDLIQQMRLHDNH